MRDLTRGTVSPLGRYNKIVGGSSSSSSRRDCDKNTKRNKLDNSLLNIATDNLQYHHDTKI